LIEFALGCALAATVVDAAEHDGLRVHVSDLLTRWQGAVADIYVKFGASRAVADEHATVLLAALESALILARGAPLLRGSGGDRASNPCFRPPAHRRLERSLVCACAAPAASLPVAVQVRQNVAPLAGSPSLDELGVEPSPEGDSVALKLVVSGH
jgi:hypothetical protein